jgi:hypothetical protein
MDNHYHIVVETAEGNLSKGMRQLNGVYTQYINRTYNRIGHVYQGRYKAILVEKENYLLELARYVVLNPVRAGMVKDIEEWPWSSYPAMIGKSSPLEWLQTDWILGQFGKQRKRAITAYVDFVRAGVGLPSIWDALRGQIYLGNDQFIQEMQQHMESDKDISEVPRIQRRAQAKPLSYYSSFGNRNAGIAAAYQTGDYTMKEIADAFGLHYATVSRVVKKVEK